MKMLYVYEYDTKISFRENQMIIKPPSDQIVEVPVENVEALVLFGKCELSGRTIEKLLEYRIPVTWLSHRGKYFGRLISTEGHNPMRQRFQFRAGDDPEFCLELARNILIAKMSNQKTFLKRCNRENPLLEVKELVKRITPYLYKMTQAKTIKTMMAYEGVVAKLYFQGLSLCLPTEFAFKGRSRRPPRDPFNSLLSFGYTLLMQDIYAVLINLGLNPHGGFVHEDRLNNPALASDLMEEWRSIIVDAMVMGLVNKKMIRVADFETDEQGGVYTNKTAAKILISQYQKKMMTMNQYLAEIEYPMTFRQGLEHQGRKLIQAIEANNPAIYQPLVIR